MLQRKNKEEEDSYKVKKRTADLLPDASNNIAKLEVCVIHTPNITDVLHIYINFWYKFPVDY